ncbi:major pollen allergen Ole e 6-like [Cornus florida]|uniref:major pollen allergen Ole e 6-like n=1 Tax=Cornus florida TaxID=4283 RepID=UPI002896393F|nr:major pollen allergen Ole e 6-like [Cornus florida]
MAKKLVTMLVMCIVVVAAFHVPEAEGWGEMLKDFKECYGPCKQECLDGGNGFTFCEMKCDTECGAKEFTDKINQMRN